MPEDVGKTSLTPREATGSHNNFYEFLAGQGGKVGRFVDEFEVEPWKVEINGECHKPLTSRAAAPGETAR